MCIRDSGKLCRKDVFFVTPDKPMLFDLKLIRLVDICDYFQNLLGISTKMQSEQNKFWV